MQIWATSAGVQTPSCTFSHSSSTSFPKNDSKNSPMVFLSHLKMNENWYIVVWLGQIPVKKTFFIDAYCLFFNYLLWNQSQGLILAPGPMLWCSGAAPKLIEDGCPTQKKSSSRQSSQPKWKEFGIFLKKWGVLVLNLVSGRVPGTRCYITAGA